MGLLDIIIESECDTSAIEEYAEGRTWQELYAEVRNRGSKRDAASDVIRREGLEYFIFIQITKITAQEEISTKIGNGKPGTNQLHGLATMLRGTPEADQDNRYFCQLAMDNDMPLLTQETQDFVDGFTHEYIETADKEALEEQLDLAKAANWSAQKYKFKIEALSARFEEDHSLAYALLLKMTGWEAQEEITQVGTNGKVGYSELKPLAHLLFGGACKPTEVRKKMRAFAQEQGMKRLTDEHQRYVDNFNVEYVRTSDASQLEEELHSRHVFINPDFHQYSVFQHEISKKLQGDKVLAFELMKKITGWEAIEEIRYKAKERKKGATAYAGLASLMRGKSSLRVDQEERDKEIFLQLAKEQDMDILTPKHQAYVKNFNEEYVAQTSQEQLRKELDLRGISLDENAPQYSHLMHEIAKKLQSDPKLAFELMKKYTGWTSLKEMRGIDTGYGRFTGLASLIFSDEDKSRKNRRRLFQELGEKYNLQKLTDEDEAYLEGLTVEYVERTPREQLEEELILPSGHNFDPESDHHNPFLTAISKKIRENPSLGFAIFKKISGWQDGTDVKVHRVGENLGYRQLKGITRTLLGRTVPYEGIREVIGGYFARGLLQSTEFQQELVNRGVVLDDETTYPDDMRASLDVLMGFMGREQPEPVKRAYRQRQTEWSEQDVEYLRAIAEGLSQKELAAYLKEHEDEIQDDLGRSIWAVERKLERMDYLVRAVMWGENKRSYDLVYPFPPIVRQMTHHPDVLFANYSTIMKRDGTPEAVPVFGYYDVTTDDTGVPQFIHVTIPIEYRGIEIDEYTEFEQDVLRTVQGFMYDPSSFVKRSVPEVRVGDPQGDVRILEIEGPDRSYVHLIQRTRMAESSEPVETSALGHPSGSEILLFFNDASTYQNTLPRMEPRR